MGLLYSRKPNVSKKEFDRKVMNELRHDRFTRHEREMIGNIVSGSMNEPGRERGVDERELDTIVAQLKDQRELSDEKIQAFEEAMKKNI